MRKTKHLESVLGLLNSREEAWSVDEILAANSSGANKVTLYRMLEKLQAEGTVHKINGIEGKSYYAMCHQCSKEHHHDAHAHFQCRKCLDMQCVEVETHFPKLKGLTIEDQQVLLTGLCEKCGKLQ